MTAFVLPALRLALAAACLVSSPLATAQQRPLTGQMLGDSAAPRTDTPVRPAPAPAPPHAALAAAASRAPAPRATPPAAPAQIGDTTRALLQLQASGSQAGARLPMLGDQASLSYARYLQSFTHPIPEFLDTSVRKEIAGPGGGD
ncbi:MAG: DUF3613 domain-containing protein [Stenotrophomonas maltophilia]